MLTSTELQFKQIYCGQVWESYTFPPNTPIKTIADELQCTEAPVRKAIKNNLPQLRQWTITRS